MDSQSYAELAAEALARISTSEHNFTDYTQWHNDGIIRVSLATELRVKDLGNPAAQLKEMTLDNFRTAQEVAKKMVANRDEPVEDDPVELRVAFKIIDTVCRGEGLWIQELESYKQALITAIEHSGNYTLIPCAQNSVVSAMRALWALALSAHDAKIRPCGRTPYTVPA